MLLFPEAIVNHNFKNCTSNRSADLPQLVFIVPGEAFFSFPGDCVAPGSFQGRFFYDAIHERTSVFQVRAALLSRFGRNRPARKKSGKFYNSFFFFRLN